ncbi:MAG: sulfite exporter TauE/SafE family protein [Gracilibacteraceae bacterium]|jgi:sulfite exporter TauE/SafE/copper chaperone CopZ|nr:sulfite exporter TauE/SafE family protein [Gracilibacteraceae bacterium]
MAVKKQRLHIGGMTCVNCRNKIEKRLRAAAGVLEAEVSYGAATADVTYDGEAITLGEIKAAIAGLGYEVSAGAPRAAADSNRTFGLLIMIAALFMLLQQFGLLNLLAPSRLADAQTGYVMLFVIGLVTSVHCLAMCGGINLSQCIPPGGSGGEGRLAALRPAFLYNLGRVASYTVVGFIVGALGSVLAFSDVFQGGLKLVAGLFMIIMGVNMLGIFPALRRFVPTGPKVLAGKIHAEKSKSNSPLIIGLLNGLMPCGPLQAMQIYALSTGSALAGALSMFLFSLGTVPLMFGLGALSAILSKKFTRKVMTAGAVLVVVLGLSMLSQGWNLSGLELPALALRNANTQSAYAAQPTIVDGVQLINSTLSSGKYPVITVQAGTPVRWVIDAPQGSINGCNNRMLIREYGIEHSFRTGENIIEFTPAEAKTVRYSCWMGMIRGTINVIEPGGAGTTPGETPGGDLLTTAAADGAEPVPTGVAIPTDSIAVAASLTTEYRGTVFEYQQVKITLTDEGFSPAIAVVEAGVETEWIIDVQSERYADLTLLVPLYNTAIPLATGENPLGLLPAASFEFSNGDSAAYGYVKVVDSIDDIDPEAIKAEAAAVKTLIYPPEWYEAGGARCH